MDNEGRSGGKLRFVVEGTLNDSFRGVFGGGQSAGEFVPVSWRHVEVWPVAHHISPLSHQCDVADCERRELTMSGWTVDERLCGEYPSSVNLNRKSIVSLSQYFHFIR